jgi:HEAT repeat protein
LRKALKHQDGNVRSGAASVLGEIGPAAKDAVPDLIEALKDRDMRPIAVGALGRIGPAAKDAVPALIEALKDQHFIVCNAAAKALEQIRLQKPK